MAADAATNEHAGLEYEVGEVWEVDSAPDEHIVPPHVENIIVHRARRLKGSAELEKAILRFMPPVTGGPDKLFDGRLQASTSGALYIAERTGLPSRSTMFWRPDQPLALDYEGKRIRYRYPTRMAGARSLSWGFKSRWKPSRRARSCVCRSRTGGGRRTSRSEELRCYVQLSGWFPYQSSQAFQRATHPCSASRASDRALACAVESDRADSRSEHSARQRRPRPI